VLLAIAAAGPLAGGAHVCAAQAAPDVVVDEGSFTISRGGATVGREAFSIRRTDGAGYVATATVVYTDRRLAAALNVDSSGTPARYQLDVRSAAGRQELLTARTARGYFSIRSQTPRGEAARELLMSPLTRLLDDGIFSQWFFIVRHGPPGEPDAVPVIEPQRGAQATLRVEAAPSDTVWIDGHVIQATHLHARTANGEAHDVWTDADGRLLAVVTDRAGTATVARRDEMPR
jgi:hypothetical protein